MPLTLEDLREHINAPTVPPEGSARRREWQRALDTASQEITRMTGLLHATTATVRVRGSGTVSLPYVRLTSVTVADALGAVVVPWATDLEAGLLMVGSTSGPWSVTCTRDEPWPAALESAALDWAAHIVDVQRTTLNATSDDDVGLPSFALPNRVAQFVHPYRLPGAA